MQKQYEAVLFIYRVETRQDFWVPAGEGYGRFALTGGRYRLVRCQAYLPPFSTGYCAGVTREEQRQMIREASRHGLRLNFYTTPQECEKQAVRQCLPQHVFDRGAPAGVYSLDGIIYSKDRDSSSS